MKVFVPKESRAGETRVALSPAIVKQLCDAGFECFIEPDAGKSAFFSNDDYQNAGGIVAGSDVVWNTADVVLKVNPPTLNEAGLLKEGAVLIALLHAFTNLPLVEICCNKGISAFALDAVPRISRAQKMDVLSSQANLAGYKSVMLGANALGKIFPLLMTAAGTITPAKVLIFGAGVAGLQAIATAKRLGAVVEVTDVRPETKEQVESLGAKFLQVDGNADAKTEGGYAREVSDDFLRKQRQLIEKHITQADLVITTAQVLGKKAPVLITDDMVKMMKPGAVIVDMAVEQGGNCTLSEAGKIKQVYGVQIIGQTNLPALLPVNASELFAKNIATLLLHLADAQGFKFDMEDEITVGCLITHKGDLVHQQTKDLINRKG